MSATVKVFCGAAAVVLTAAAARGAARKTTPVMGWESVMLQVDLLKDLWSYTKPGSMNDPDMPNLTSQFFS